MDYILTGIQLVSELIHFCESPKSFDSIQRMLPHIPFLTPSSILIKSMLPSHMSCRKVFRRCLTQKNKSSVTLLVPKVSHV